MEFSNNWESQAEQFKHKEAFVLDTADKFRTFTKLTSCILIEGSIEYYIKIEVLNQRQITYCTQQFFGIFNKS